MELVLVTLLVENGLLVLATAIPATLTVKLALLQPLHVLLVLLQETLYSKTPFVLLLVHQDGTIRAQIPA